MKTNLILIILFTQFIVGCEQHNRLNSVEKAELLSKPINGNTFVIAHRGAHKEIPENTLAAYEEAINLGCDFVEIDIRLTKDSQLVSIHNSTIDAYTNKYSGKIADFTLSELKQIDIGSRIDPKWKNERIPTFEEILKLCKNKIGIYLDVKEPYVNELLRLINKYNMEKQIVWYIPYGNKESISLLKSECPECFPMPDPDLDEIEDCINEFDPLVIAPVMSQFSKEYVEKAQKQDVMVFVDEKEGTEKEWTMILESGADGIQSDDPERLIKYLKREM